jgi:MoaA/NifB/PqqE/SkfB family radical SAM enzyme
MTLTLLYRGDLSSCNYACHYCPFAKRQDTREQLAKDNADLQRFVTWVGQQHRDIAILFTPWGEALIRGYYREAITQLSHMPQVKKVAIQTNFSCSTTWLKHCDLEKTAFWITYHPHEIELERFIATCQQLDQYQVRYSVGVVGLKAHFSLIQQLRQKLATHIYLWVNAYKRETHYYTPSDIQQLLAIDPHFENNNSYHQSLHSVCTTGESVISVNGAGDITRCHFIKQKLGNIYQQSFTDYLRPRTCSNTSCGCHIGYIHLEKLQLYPLYGEGLLERIAKSF